MGPSKEYANLTIGLGHFPLGRQPSSSSHLHTVCVQTHLVMSHHDVLTLSRHRLARLPESHVTSIQHVIGHLISPGMADRWLVHVNNEAAKRELLKGMFIGNTLLVVRAFEDVVRADNLRVLRYQNSQMVLEELRITAKVRKTVRKSKVKNAKLKD